ncbi:FGGY-family carbohydrate kinase [Devosia sp. XJ19-1]|uniref:FGGY-family carbohydrate kinase n=1 Tax=Devosia ureilytica TaxID=2952754 RepID=A0A9Q4FSZ3_9HYPH|nr:FGGY-family carbohydrate kinase [Devosia ureilytica]MCP8884219.1 FGGY-family carbohydrate kinase [Devosia ureilytica]MCP8887827.1 FGGY-family carbohydrate kinase [Devosia ureilytica]
MTTTPRHVAVIDIGKTNAKVVLIDSATRAQLAAEGTPNRVLRDGPYPHADVERLWAFIAGCLRTFHAAHGIDGISITTHGATGALLAGEELALPVLDYESDAPEASEEAYARMRPGFAETLSPRLPNGLNWGAQIFWQSRAFPEDFARVTAIIPYPQYWAWRLTGTLASEVTSLGCHTDLWAPDKGDFSSLVDTMGWRQLFPGVQPAASVIGTLRPAIAAETGLPETTPVTCGIHDSNASLLPHLGHQDAPFTIVSTGTWTILMTVGGDTAGLDPARDSLANVDAFGRPVPTARFMGGREFDVLVPEIAEPSAADVAHVIANDVQALPSFAPGVGPFGGNAGRWTVDPASLSAGQRTAAASLYLALVARACLDLCGLGRSITLEGPLARNGLFGAALARLSGVPVHASGDATGTSLGASLLFGGTMPEAGSSHAIGDLQVDGFDTYVANWRARLSP